ncbi:hypothetical protein HS041_22515 [Planomonospora sp. ID67723]|uniref:hypothetical protein n=1 Tax=Planomonospora sp. ID67723 TaxID=2738134 RepID=UPI0018C404D6|nr:hypothetical protein [Planomonospora sp. ID67723]MBG0830539.1 hypothetical protein [Planomonospora sp. ID67723]
MIKDWFCGDPTAEVQRLRARVRELEALVAEAAELGDKLLREQERRARLDAQLLRERTSYEITVKRLQEVEGLLGEREASALDKLAMLPKWSRPTPGAELLQERARADALAQRVEELQAANLRLYKIHM